MTIREVAARAGVSPATVSRVFTQPQAVTLQTRQRVLEAADELRYAPNPVARSLARGRTGNLGIVVPDLANSFSALATKAVQHQARRDGYALFVADADDQAGGEARLARAIAQQVDGLVLLSPTMTDGHLCEIAASTPVVVINRMIGGVPAVLMPTADGAGHAVEHLHALEHRELVYLAGPDNYSNEVRSRAFTAACARLGLRGSRIGPFEPTPSGGVRAADLVLARSATGVLAYNDDIAVGVVNRLADRGVRVPDDVSIVGFDDTWLAEIVNPRLTTVRLPIVAAGGAAVSLLLDVMRDGDTTRRPIELTTELIVRASTGPAPAAGTGGAA
jgi:DNA-binding LacI/PurR family transcriptional regulator